MRNLLSANIHRLLKNKIFWMCTAAMFCFTVFIMLQAARVDAMYERGRSLDYYYFHTLPYFGLFLSVFISLFLGTEYEDGVIRNKIVVGHTRTNIYLANLITCFAGSFVIFMAWAIGGLAGIPHFGIWEAGISGYGMLLIASLCSVFSIASILMPISQLIAGKGVSGITSAFVSIGLLVLASTLYNLLCEPEMISGAILVNNQIQMTDPEPNPMYIGGTLRTVFEICLRILPTGQQILIADEKIAYPLLFLAFSLPVILLMSVMGMRAFRKKDLK